MSDAPELYRQYRPTTFKRVRAQPEAVAKLKSMLAANKVPHVLTFTGPTGCGKTTLARIMVVKLGCSDTDFYEINGAQARGVDTIREIASQMQLSAMAGPVKIYYIDEAHMLTRDAQNALLKMLEDTPSHVYFFLATTDPNKLLPTIISRSTEIRVKRFQAADLEKLIKETASYEAVEVSDEVVACIVEHAEGSARQALVLLHAALCAKGEEAQLAAITATTAKTPAIALARALLARAVVWADIAKLLRGLENEDPEGLRRMLLGYCASVVLGGGALAPKADRLIYYFERHFYDSGRAGLVSACYNFVRELQKR